MARTSDGLTDRQEKFCLHYVTEMNATKAALAAGYSAKTAMVQGYQLLQIPLVRARVTAMRDELFAQQAMTNAEIVAEASHLGRFRLGNLLHITADGEPYPDLSNLTDGDKAALAEATIEDFVDMRERDEEGNPIRRDVRRVKIKAHNKLGALELLAKMAGLLREKVDVNVTMDDVALLEAGRARARGEG